MGRAPCCDKANVKKGPWSPEEDAKLKSYIEQHGTGGNWIALPQKMGLKRCGKSCRLRWLNYLRPNLKHGGFSEEEDNIICSLYISIGSRWSIIAAQLPGRTDNDIKNYWNTRLKKKLLGKQRKDHQQARKASKQGSIRKGSGSSNSDNIIINNQNPYWPELPALPPLVPYAYSNQLQQSSFNDHASLRKLLIKLGGRFSHDDCIQPIHHPPQSSKQVHEEEEEEEEEAANIPSSSDPTVLMSNTGTQFAPLLHDHHHHQYINTDAVLSLQQQMLQGESSSSCYSAEVEEMVYNNPQSTLLLDGLEFLYGDEDTNNLMNNNRNGTATSSWGEIGNYSLVCPPLPSDYQGCLQQEMPQESLFNDHQLMSYQRSH